MNAQTLGMIRHTLTLVGGFLVAIGVLNEDTVSQLTEAVLGVAGGVIAIVGIIMSWKKNRPEAKK